MRQVRRDDNDRAERDLSRGLHGMGLGVVRLGRMDTGRARAGLRSPCIDLCVPHLLQGRSCRGGSRPCCERVTVRHAFDIRDHS